MSKYLNLGSITALLQLVLGFLAAIRPDVFTADRQAQIAVSATSFGTSALGAVHLFDELLAAWKTPQTTASPQASTPTSFVTSSPSATTTLKILAPLALASMLFFAGGCNQTPLYRSIEARDIYTAAEHTVNVLHDTGVVSVADKETIKPLRDAVRSAVDAMEQKARDLEAVQKSNNAQAISDAQASFDQATAAFNAALDSYLKSAGIDPATFRATQK